MPVGTPISIAPIVMATDPTIMGKIPYDAGLFDGDQFSPNKKLLTP